MSNRRRAREVCMQALFQLDVNPDTQNETLRTFVQRELNFPALEDFSWQRIDGVRSRQIEIDGMIAKLAENWGVDRMPPVDRNILRLAIYELAFVQDVPGKVAINEALEIAKRFSGADSAAFLNGVLDKAFRLLVRDDAKA